MTTIILFIAYLIITVVLLATRTIEGIAIGLVMVYLLFFTIIILTKFNQYL